MTTATLSLTDFLLARIAEDEAGAREASRGGWSYPGIDTVSGGLLYDGTRQIAQISWDNPGDHDGTVVRTLPAREADANGAHIARHDPARVLAECEAKRRIVELAGVDGGVFDDDAEDGIRYDGYPVTRALAAIYADHPDYRSDWSA